MTRSEQINELCAAMAKAQAEMTGAKKDSTNPHFRSAYADLASVRDACMPYLNKHGLAVFQFPRLVAAGEGAWVVEIETKLTHSSGQFMSDVLAVPVSKPDAQGVGSAITYGRRYALGAVAGIAPEDDDGNAAVGTNVHGNGHAKAAPAADIPSGFQDWWDDIKATAANGVDALKSAWTASPAQYRTYVTKTNLQAWEALKAAASKVAA